MQFHAGGPVIRTLCKEAETIVKSQCIQSFMDLLVVKHHHEQSQLTCPATHIAIGMSRFGVTQLRPQR